MTNENEGVRLGEYLRQLREARTRNGRTLSQYDVNVDLGWPANSYQRIEAGKRAIPSPATLGQLAEYFDTTQAELLRAAGYDVPVLESASIH